MFKQLSILAVAAGLATTVSAVGSAKVLNNCDHEVTVWAVGKDVSMGHTLQHGESWGEPYAVDPKTGGRALKVTVERDGLFTHQPETIYAYSLDGGNLWYDLSDVFGDAFSGNKLRVASEDTNCPVIEWDNGVSPAGSQTKVCGSDRDITLTLCA